MWLHLIFIFVQIRLLTEIQEIFDLYDSMERKNIMLSFKGDMSCELLTSILQIVENKLDRFGESTKVKKRMFSILVECMQNLHHHIHDVVPDEMGETPSVIVMVAKNVTGYSVITGNFVRNRQVEELKRKLEEINAMSKEEVKELYKTSLATGGLTEKGGGGLGMIDIARRSGRKIGFGFSPSGDGCSFFSLNVKVDQES